MKKYLSIFFIVLNIFFITSCGFHLQGEAHLAEPLHRMFLQTPDPYGSLARSLQQYLKLSKVHLVSSPEQASTILVILHDDSSQELLGISGTQQTRQYMLKVTVVFEITDPKGRTIIGPQTLTESRSMTVQSNQVMGSSNEATLFYQQMRRNLAYAIMTRLASNDITLAIDHEFVTSITQNSPAPVSSRGPTGTDDSAGAVE